MTDRELLELAAKALGIEIRWERNRGKMVARQQSAGYYGRFDPKNDSYDSMLLMTGCRITVDQSWRRQVVARWGHDDAPHELQVDCTDENRMEATRRAIIRAAAEIGKGMLNG